MLVLSSFDFIITTSTSDRVCVSVSMKNDVGESENEHENRSWS